MDAEPRLRGQVVDAMHAREEAVLLAGGVAQPAQDVADRLGVDHEAGLTVLVVRGDDGALPDRIELLGDQLEAGSVGHQPIVPRAAAYASSASALGAPIDSSRAHSSVPSAL